MTAHDHHGHDHEEASELSETELRVRAIRCDNRGGCNRGSRRRLRLQRGNTALDGRRALVLREHGAARRHQRQRDSADEMYRFHAGTLAIFSHAGNGGIGSPGVANMISVMALTLRFP